MIQIFVPEGTALRKVDFVDGQPLPANAVWIDLLRPLPGEVAAVERTYAIDVPTREEMQEIEVSSRLYEEDGRLFMTATLLALTFTEQPQSGAGTFILDNGRLITVRYVEPRSFELFAARVVRPGAGLTKADILLAALLDAVIDRVADVLEHVAAAVDALSQSVFAAAERTTRRDFRALLVQIGHKGDLVSKTRETLGSFGRLLRFYGAASENKAAKDIKARLKTLNRDVLSLTDYVGFLSAKITFLLEATLGMISIEQNNTIKIFSVVAFVFLPPTLIASIYGMNFAAMPELSWPWGYPLALLAMIASAVAPYLFFKRRGWL